jgi:hypothetical protein
MAVGNKVYPRRAGLLDLGLFELDVLLHDGIVLFENELFRAGARVFLGDIEKTCPGGGQQFDLLCDRLGHGF